MSDIKTLIAGNWKMHGLGASLSEIDLLGRALAARRPENMEILICPPATLLSRLREPANRAGISLGGQDCHAEQQGAHTGDISAEMLRDAGAATIIVGHSERRADHGETDATVRAKAGAVHRAGLEAIICLGETLAERDAGDTLAIVKHQLAGSLPAGAGPENTVIAYEPVWAIGTGRTPTVENVSQVHACLRELLTTRFGADGRAFRILYGGSVKAANAHELLSIANVNGALVGGASLKAEDFYGIIDACPRSGA